MKTNLFVLFLCLLGTVSLSAQTRIKGVVHDEKQQPAPFANVLLLQSKDSSLVQGAVSEPDGTFMFDGIQPGNYRVSVSMVGYQMLYGEALTVNAGQEEIALPPVQLAAPGVQLQEVVVKAERSFIELKHDKLIVNVDASPVAAGNTALELLSKSPGIAVDQDNRISLKGKQGVLVMINGKNTYMSVEEVARMLETMPASSVESIEIIHNPSARYDAAGNAGIINIRLKKEKGLGLNGNLTAGLGYWENPRANGEMRFNYRQKAFNLFGGYSKFYNKRFQDIEISRVIPYEGMVTNFVQNTDMLQWSNSNRINLGADFFLSKKTTIGVLSNGNLGNWNVDGNSLTNISGDNPELFDQVASLTDGREEWDDLVFNVNLRHQFNDKGRELSFDADYSDLTNRTDNAYENTYYTLEKNEVGDPYLLRSGARSGVTIKALKMDYTHPLSEKTTFEAGWKSSFVETDNNILFQDWKNDQWVDDARRSNQFRYIEDIHAGYFNLSTQIKGISLQMGLRGEYTRSDGLSVTLNQQVVRDYFNLFPSLSVSHQVGKNHSLSYSYSRRVDRPTYQDLNPFVNFLDQYTFEKGNPFLQPQFTNAYGVNYSYKGSYMLNLNYSRTNDAITQVLEQDDANRQTYQTNANLARFESLSLTASAPVKVASWWNTRFNATSFYNIFQSPFQSGEIDKDQFSLRINVSNSLTLPGGLKGEISGFYSSRMLWGIFEVSPTWSMDLGLSKPILKNKGTLRLNVSDVFFTSNPIIEVNQGSMNVDVVQNRETRRVNLTLNYKFGNSDVKPARRRSTATDEEQNRVKRN